MDKVTINELIAEHVMGWEPALEADDEWYKQSDSDEDTYCLMVWNGSQGYYQESPDMCVDHDMFNPMEDMEDAMQVFEKCLFREMRRYYGYFSPWGDACWRVWSANADERGEVLQEVICIAALKAHNIEVPE
jgi:hypothetical protein